jgi:type II secretory pathway pseudopilin PulG
MSARRGGLTLTELLVVVLLVAVAAVLLFPAVQALRQASLRAGCQNNLRQLGLALTAYHKANGHFPAAYLRAAEPTEGRVPSSRADTAPGWGWAAALLPYVGQEPLARQVDVTVKVEDPRFEALRTKVVGIFQCPADQNTGVFTVTNAAEETLTQAATNSYAANFGGGGRISQQPDQGNGVFFANSQISLPDISRGASNTLALGERGAIVAQTPWVGAVSHGTVPTMPGAPVTARVVEGAPVQVLAGVHGGLLLNDPASTPACFFSPHPGVVLFALADGSARPFSTHTDYTVLEALATRADGKGKNKGAR